MTERKLNISGEFEKPTWDWTPVECILKTTEHNRKSVQWQLAPSILLTNPASTNSDPHVRLFIDTEKSLSYAPDLGWNWHKSWNLPNISIRLEVDILLHRSKMKPLGNCSWLPKIYTYTSNYLGSNLCGQEKWRKLKVLKGYTPRCWHQGRK